MKHDAKNDRMRTAGVISLSALLVPHFFGGSAHAQELELPAESKTAVEATISGARTHLLHLTEGVVLRVQARFEAGATEDAAGTWHVRRGREWVQLPGERVVRAAPESEVIRESRKLARGLGSIEDDPIRHVAYADWMVSQGLHAEALRELDRILSVHPDQAEALSLIERARLPIALPPLPGPSAQGDVREALDAYLLAATRGGPSVREIALARIVEHEEVPGLTDVLTEGLVNRSPKRRAFAAHAMRRLLPGRYPTELLSRALLDASGDVRESAGLALRAADEPELIVPALRALGAQNAAVRKNAIEALATMDYAAAVAPLYTHLVNLKRRVGTPRAPRSHIYVGTQRAIIQDYDVEVASNSAIADPVINVIQDAAVLDAAVVGVTEYVVQTERAATRRALAQLTGASPGNTTAAWESWWKKHGDEWIAAAKSPDRSASVSRVR